MIANRDSVPAVFDPFQVSDAEPSWVGREWGAQEAVVRDKRILLVEDEAPLRASLRMMLELDGHRVTESGNGAEALKKFTIDEFDLVITDFEMPVMEGNELAAGIKLMAPSQPILMVTASEKARGNTRNPVDALLNKPLTLAVLRRALERLLSVRPKPAKSSAALL